jgi:uncharacterized caspase-like protein
VRKLVDADATRGIVRRSPNELAAALDPDQGTLFFYFSGHGFQQDDHNYLATFGSTADDLKGEGLAVSDIESILRSSHARQSMMFIDACRNNLAARAVGGYADVCIAGRGAGPAGALPDAIGTGQL